MRNLVHPDEKSARNSARWWRVLLGSIAFHALLLGLVAAALLLARTSHRPVASGSPEAVMTLSLARPSPASRPATPPAASPPAPPKKAEPTPVAPSIVVHPAPEKPTPQPAPPAEGVPVLALHPKPVQGAPKTPAPAHPAVTRIVNPARTPSAASAAHVAAVASSFASGENVFPHPPYPEEARERRQIGTVTVSVQFDAQGRVAGVEITQSSGSFVLDHSTTSFIRSNWRSVAEANQTVSVPVRYYLENM